MDHLIRFLDSRKDWVSIQNEAKRSVPILKSDRVSKIEMRLKEIKNELNQRIEWSYAQARLVEVEIYSGASKDILWKNAHPDFEGNAALFLSTNDTESSAPAGQNLFWGTIGTISQSTGELWEDELGSFKADLPDQCSNKERYLALLELEKDKRKAN